MKGAEFVAAVSGELSRWFDRAADAFVIGIDARNAVVCCSRAFLTRNGLSDRQTGLRLDDLVQSDERGAPELLVSPRHGAPVGQWLCARGDDTRWWCCVFEADDVTVIVGTKTELIQPDGDRRTALIVADLAAAQHELLRVNAELSRAKAKLAEAVGTDELTGVASRRALNQRIALETARAKRGEHPLSMVGCDIDHFKRVNDEFGHGAGDACLRVFGAILAREGRTVDLPARQGGEEFCVLTPDTTLSSAAILAERIRATTEATVIPDIGRAVTVSLGVAQFRPSESAQAWTERCDRAVYRAKTKGRNRVERED